MNVVNTSIISDPRFRELVLETLRELDSLDIDDDIHRWITFTAKKKERQSYTVSKRIVRNTI